MRPLKAQDKIKLRWTNFHVELITKVVINYKKLAEKIDNLTSRQSRGRASEGDWQQGSLLSKSGPGVLSLGRQ